MTWPTALAAVLALLVYLRSPIDLLPDRLGAIGLLDDALAVALTIWWLRRRAAQVRAARERPARAAGGTDATEGAAWDPYAVLGVAPGASAEEISAAYRERMRQYHPDRVAHLGEELRQLAHRKTLDIQRAYAQLRRQ